MVQNIILGGVPRSGKTTLARRVCREFGLSHVSLDAIVKAFEKSFPDIGISNDAPDYQRLCDVVRPFLFEHLHWLGAWNIPFLLDGYYIRPKDLESLDVKGGWAAVFLGYPSVAASDHLTFLRGHEGDGDWTRTFSDEVLLADIERFSEASVRMREWCLEANVPFVDVGACESEALDEAYKLIASALLG